MSTSDTFATKLVDTQTVNSQYTPVVQLPAGNLYWRVRVTGSGDLGWANADFNRGTLAVPTMLGPTGTLPQPSSPPLISWTPVQGALAYNLQISSDPDFIDPTKIVNFTPTKTTTGISPVLAVPGTYYARVRATMATNIFTGYATPISYTIEGLAAATRISPPNAGTVTDAVWTGSRSPAPRPTSPDGRRHQLRFAGGQPVNITGTRYSPPETIGNDTYYWRVRPVDAAGNARAWTVEDRGLVPAGLARPGPPGVPRRRRHGRQPLLLPVEPERADLDGQEDLALSSSYTLEVSTSSTFQGTVMRCNTINTTWVPGSSLNGNDNQQCWPGGVGHLLLARHRPRRLP